MSDQNNSGNTPIDDLLYNNQQKFDDKTSEDLSDTIIPAYRKQPPIAIRINSLQSPQPSQILTPTPTPYTKPIMLQIQKLYEKASCYRLMHEYSEGVCNTRSKVLGYPCKLFSTVAGTLAGVNMTAERFNSPYILGTITIISSVLNMTEAFTEYAKRSQAHKEYKFKFQSILNEIEENLSLDDNSRIESVEFLKYITDRITNYMNGGSPSFTMGSEKYLQEQIKDIQFNNPFKLHKLNIKMPASPVEMMQVRGMEYV